MGFKKEIINRLDRIDSHLSKQDGMITSHTIQLEINNKELSAHTRRSTMLEDRFRPIEEVQIFWNKFTKVFLAVLGICASAATIWYKMH